MNAPLKNGTYLLFLATFAQIQRASAAEAAWLLGFLIRMIYLEGGGSNLKCQDQHETIKNKVKAM